MKPQKNTKPSHKKAQLKIMFCILCIFVANAAAQAPKERAPGITENKIVIGTMVDTSGLLAEFGRAVTAVTNAYVQEINSQGGIYGRRLELRVIETSQDGLQKQAKLEPVLKAQEVFAMSAAMIAGAEIELVPLFSKYETPLIGPFSLYGQTGHPVNRQVFYVLSGFANQTRSLLNFLRQKPESKNLNIAVLSPRNDVFTEVVEAVRDQRKKQGSTAPMVIEYVQGRFDVADAIKQMRQASIGILLVLGATDEQMPLLLEAAKLNWFPFVLSPGGAIGATILAAPVGFDRKVFFSFPIVPADQTAESRKEFRALAEKYKLPSTHVVTQMTAYVAFKILVEGIRRAGKDVNREKLIQVLEGFQQYSTGLTPAITYGPNRRMGSMGAYVVAVDLKEKNFVPVSEWIDSN